MSELEDTAGKSAGTEEDPFSPENAPGLNLITSMRIYDVLLGMYFEMNPEKADALMKKHQAGQVIGPLPNFNP